MDERLGTFRINPDIENVGSSEPSPVDRSFCGRIVVLAVVVDPYELVAMSRERVLSLRRRHLRQPETMKCAAFLKKVWDLRKVMDMRPSEACGV
jgi:hypothetical protein